MLDPSLFVSMLQRQVKARLRTYNRLIPPLEQMPDLAVSEVIVSRVSKLQVLHDLRKRRYSNFLQQMNMIFHQHISIEFRAISVLHLFKQRQVALAVQIVVENDFPMISTTDDVIKSSRENESEISELQPANSTSLAE